MTQDDNNFQANIFSKLMGNKEKVRAGEKSTTFQNNIFDSLMGASKDNKKAEKNSDIEIATEVTEKENKEYTTNIFSNLMMNKEERIDNSYTNSIFKTLQNIKVYNIGYFVSYESESFISNLISLFEEKRFSNYNLILFFDTVDTEKNESLIGKVSFEYDYKNNLSDIERDYLSKSKLDLVVTMENSEDGIEIVKRSLQNDISVLTINSNHINELIKNNIELLGSYLTLADDENSILKKLNYLLPTLEK